jgi:putative membrane protein insertion efficiency factor
VPGGVWCRDELASRSCGTSGAVQMKFLLIGFLRAYRFVISPMYGQVCRYYPSCSAYALEAVTVHGSIKGSWLALRRVLRCHPWTPGGYDPVPPRSEPHPKLTRGV